jgi:hypothetical protein
MNQIKVITKLPNSEQSYKMTDKVMKLTFCTLHLMIYIAKAYRI